MNQYRSDGDVVIGPELKHTIKIMIRAAILWQNRQVLFTCRHCCFYQPQVIGGVEAGDEDEEDVVIDPVNEACTLESTNRLMLSKRQPTQLPECFLYDPLSSSFAGVLTLLYSLGIDTLGAEYGWATIISRLAARQNRYGYIGGVTPKNLEKYGTS